MPAFGHEAREPLYSAGSESAVRTVRDIGTCFCAQTLCVHGIVGYLCAGRLIGRHGPRRGSTEDTRVRHHSWRSGTGKGDRLCRSERISPSGSSASENLASWPAWRTAAAAPCWPGAGARDAMRSPSRTRTSSRRIGRRFAFARRPVWHAGWRALDGGLLLTARTAWNDDFGCGVAATCARHARVGGALPTVHWSFAICQTSPIRPATAMASSPVARVAAPCSAID